MDRLFMEQYFDKMYDDVIAEIVEDDAEYAELQASAEEAIKKLADLVAETNPSLWKHCEDAMDGIYSVQFRLMKLAYLQGAEDREKMLR